MVEMDEAWYAKSYRYMSTIMGLLRNTVCHLDEEKIVPMNVNLSYRLRRLAEVLNFSVLIKVVEHTPSMCVNKCNRY
jgi:hypothetical protein